MTAPEQAKGLADLLLLYGRDDVLNTLAADKKRLTVGEREAIEGIQELAMKTAAALTRIPAPAAAGEAQALREEVAALKAQLQPYLDAEAEQVKQRQFDDRIQLIIQLLFPQYDARSVDFGHTKRPPIHPTKSWWWNGASLRDVEQLHDGYRLSVNSYTGRGSEDDFSFDIPVAWVTTEDPRPMILQWIAEEQIRQYASARAEEIAKHQYELKRATERLAQLQGNSK